MGKPSAGADLGRGDDAADRTGFHHRHRPRGRDLRRHHAAVRAHDGEIAGKADRREALRKACHVAADLRPDIGVHHRRRHPLELAVLAQDLVRQRQVGIGQRRPHDLAGDLLVLGIDVGVEEAHRDRFHALGAQHGAGLFDARTIERLTHLAGAHHPLLGLAGQSPRYQWTMAVEQQVVGLRAVAATDDVDVARPAGDDQAGLGALALDQRIDGDGRAVDELVDRRDLDPALPDAIDDALYQVGRRGQALGLHEAPNRIVEPDQVGERAADIHRNEDHARRSAVRARTPASQRSNKNAIRRCHRTRGAR